MESRRIVLEAPGGRGKTTTLVQLAERHSDQGELAFLIDLPVWVTSRVGLLEFIARTPAFLSHGVHAEDLAKLYRAVHCSFLLNGWNEVSDKYSEEATRALRDLERNFPTAGIIVATRTHHIRPPLPGSFRTRLLPLSRQQRSEYLQQALAGRAEILGAQLDGDRVLDDLTRTPLILAEVTTIFRSGASIPKTKVGVLGAVMTLLEQSDEHRDSLERQPLTGRVSDYLAELAVHMTAEGNVTIEDARARNVVHSASQQLSAGGQIVTLPEPTAILSTLCAHHVLERLEHPSVGFRFQHQQFQEFYATSLLKLSLWGLVGRDDPDGNRRFAREYLNKPVWEEPLRMIAEEIGQLSVESAGGVETVAAGRLLIELTLAIDPIFAAEMSRLCGPVVWNDVRGIVAERLRSWYRVPDEHHRRCALAGMLASGCDEFIDIILPLLTSDDQQVRLSAYRAWGEFHLSSLGSNWRRIVEGWREEHRADFIGEVVRERWMADIAEEFAIQDPSPRVRTAALRALSWVGASDALARVLTAFDEEEFEEVLLDRVLDSVPVGLQPRALATYDRLLQKVEDSPERLRIRLAAAEAGGESVLEGVKEELIRWPSGRVADTGQWLLKSAIELVRRTDPHWVSHWVATRIVDGSLWGDQWTTLVSIVPETLRRELLERIGGEDVGHNDARRIVSVLAINADADLAGEVFSRLCGIRSDISNAGGGGDATRWAISRQLEDLFRTMLPNVAVSGMLSRLSPEFDPGEYGVVLDLFGRIGVEDLDLRSQIQDDLMQSSDPNSCNGRLKGLARTVAVLDGKESAEFVMEIMARPCEWDGWTRADALEALLFSGARLRADAALSVLNPTIDHIRTREFHDQQAVYLLLRCLCLLPFLDPPSIGIARIREAVAAARFPRYELRQVVTSLGHSRSNEALGLLIEIATAGGDGLQSIATEWIDAVAALDMPESKQVLLSFVDPEIGHPGMEQHFEHHGRERLAFHIAKVARAEPTVKERLYLLCARQLSPPVRLLLADVLAQLGTPDALFVGLDLIHDHANPPVPYKLVQGLENVFLERRPYGNEENTYTLQPRSANEIRRRLFEMVLNDDNRRCSAWALLGQIESWRLEYGRPSSEPRHPAFDSGESWPPITRVN